MVAAPPAPVHWTTYVQTFAVIASTIGTFVYVWFTYHIMKWAVGEGKSAVKLAEHQIQNHQSRLLAGSQQLLLPLFAIVRQTKKHYTISDMAEILSASDLFFKRLDEMLAKGEVSVAMVVSSTGVRENLRVARNIYSQLLETPTESDECRQYLLEGEAVLSRLIEAAISLIGVIASEVDKLVRPFLTRPSH